MKLRKKKGLLACIFFSLGRVNTKRNICKNHGSLIDSGFRDLLQPEKISTVVKFRGTRVCSTRTVHSCMYVYNRTDMHTCIHVTILVCLGNSWQ